MFVFQCPRSEDPVPYNYNKIKKKTKSSKLSLVWTILTKSLYTKRAENKQKRARFFIPPNRYQRLEGEKPASALKDLFLSVKIV